ncbi:hypothetical protein ACTA71_000345 [Dictyostelium dimigraforme]
MDIMIKQINITFHKQDKLRVHLSKKKDMKEQHLPYSLYRSCKSSKALKYIVQMVVLVIVEIFHRLFHYQINTSTLPAPINGINCYTTPHPLPLITKINTPT